MVQLSTNEYIIQESSGEVCLDIKANSTINEPFSVFVMPIVKEPTSAAGKVVIRNIIFVTEFDKTKHTQFSDFNLL